MPQTGGGKGCSPKTSPPPLRRTCYWIRGRACAQRTNTLTLLYLTAVRAHLYKYTFVIKNALKIILHKYPDVNFLRSSHINFKKCDATIFCFFLLFSVLKRDVYFNYIRFLELLLNKIRFAENFREIANKMASVPPLNLYARLFTLCENTDKSSFSYLRLLKQIISFQRFRICLWYACYLMISEVICLCFV